MPSDIMLQYVVICTILHLPTRPVNAIYTRKLVKCAYLPSIYLSIFTYHGLHYVNSLLFCMLNTTDIAISELLPKHDTSSQIASVYVVKANVWAA